MSQLLYGSICIEDLFISKTVKGKDGKTYVCLDNLSEYPFAKSESNGKHYANVTVWVNDLPDNYGNDASIQLSQKKEDRLAKVKPQYIGNLKKNQPKAAAPEVVTASAPSSYDLPF